MITEKPRRKRSPRFSEVAAAAGVSMATVDRVLNERDSVSAATRKRVLEAAARLGLPRHLPQADHALVHLDILLPKNDTPFYRRLTAALRDAISMLDRRVIVHRTSLPESDPAAMARAIEAPAHPRAGLILAASDEPMIRQALAKALARGEKAVVVVTEIGGAGGGDPIYVGMDNHRAGLAAGDLMARFLPQGGRVVMLGSQPYFRAHSDRLRGFRAALPAGFVVDLVETETRDEADRVQRAMLRALRTGEVAGIYYSGAGGEGIARALATHAPRKRPIWVGHEASEDHILFMQQGLMDAVIDQDPAGQALTALQRLLFETGVTDRAPAKSQAEARIYMRHNLP